MNAPLTRPRLNNQKKNSFTRKKNAGKKGVASRHWDFGSNNEDSGDLKGRGVDIEAKISTSSPPILTGTPLLRTSLKRRLLARIDNRRVIPSRGQEERLQNFVEEDAPARACW